MRRSLATVALAAVGVKLGRGALTFVQASCPIHRDLSEAAAPAQSPTPTATSDFAARLAPAKHATKLAKAGSYRSTTGIIQDIGYHVINMSVKPGRKCSEKTGHRQILAMALRRTTLFSALGVIAALAHTGVPAQDVRVSCKPAQVAFYVPRSWTEDNEQTLFEQGFVVPPEPLYALVASPGPLPSHNAFNPASVPWLFVTVETDGDLLPPSQLYQLAPEYLQYLADGNPTATTSVKSLVAPRSVQEGGLSGSAAVLTVASGGSSTSIDEAAYEKGDRLWLIIAGCSTPCYGKNQATITQIMDSVRVGSAV
jgi:hypothetical protein